MARLFGTDGVRGIANTELTCNLAYKIGKAATLVVRDITGKAPVIAIGKDTRISSDMLCAALSAGVCSNGGKVLDFGVIPTPAIALLTKQYEADAGVVITASHNPFEHNGIKIFSAHGYKLSDELEDKIETLIKEDKLDDSCITGANIGNIRTVKDAVDKYVEFLSGTTAVIRRDIKVVFDCANGASSTVIGPLVKAMGISAKIINAAPDGMNVNLDCGSTHLEQLVKAVKTYKCDLGIAFDGDADRMLTVDEKGTVIEGDILIAMFAVALKKKGELKNNAVAVTTMTNMGFFEAMKNNGIEASITDVGDKYVLRRMLEESLSIGGERSGHIIFGDITTTGDGLLSALKLLELLSEERKPLSECAKVMTEYPQVLINSQVPAPYKSKYKNDAILNNAVGKAQETLGENGRIIVRASGTEPLIRVMVEGKNLEQIKEIAQSIIGIIDLNSAK